MGMLEKAKADKSDDKKDEKPKHKKHPASEEKGPPPSESADESGGDDEGADSEPPQADADSDEAPDTSDGAGASPPVGGDEGGDGQDDQQGADQQQEGGGGQQGGTPPVKNPQAPGAGDDTSGGDDTPPSGGGDTEGDSEEQGPATPGDDSAAGPGSTSDLQQVPMSPGLKEEYDRANELLVKSLYGSPGDALAQAVLKGILPDPQHKIRSVVHVSLMLTTQLHKKLGDFPPQLVMPFAKDVVAHVMDLGQEVKGLKYSEQESVAILGATYEGLMRIFGVNRGQAKKAGQLLGKKALLAHSAKHKQALAFAKPAIDAANGANQQQGVGAPQTAGPQSGAQPGAQVTPQQGAPAQQPPPQGGMLAQAAEASPAAQGEGNG